MPKPLTERELLEIQIKTYDFYAGLIDRAVGGATAAKMPKWDEERAREYQRLAAELRARLAELDERQAIPSPRPSRRGRNRALSRRKGLPRNSAAACVACRRRPAPWHPVFGPGED